MKSFVTAFFIFASLAMFTQAEAQTLGSCQIFPSNNPWNVRVDTMKVDSVHSAAYIASVGGSIHVHPDFGSDASYGIPWVAVKSEQAMVHIDVSRGYYTQSDTGYMPIPPNAPVESDGDGHVLVVDTSNQHLYELYQGVKDMNDNGWAAQSSAIFALDSNNFRPDGWTSCDAAGLPIFPGLVRMDECKAGAINHALRFTIGGTSNGKFKNISQQGWIFPARHEAGGTTDTTAMPMGLRLRLKASYDDSKDTGYAKVITTALKKYGMILADNGSPWYISGETNINWPDDDIGQLKAITGNDFEVVNTGYPIETDSKEYPTPVIPIPSVPSGGGVLQVSANPLNFGKVEVGHSDTMVLAISNIGNGPLIISKAGLVAQNPDFTLLSYTLLFSLPDTLQPGAMVSTPVQYTPSGVVYDTLQITITSSGSSGPTNDTITLLGEGGSNLSVAATAEPEPFTVYPNPTSGILSISANSIDGPAKIEITDQLGRTVFMQTIQSAAETLDLSGLPNGAYFTRLIGASGSASQRIILAR